MRKKKKEVHREGQGDFFFFGLGNEKLLQSSREMTLKADSVLKPPSEPANEETFLLLISV